MPAARSCNFSYRTFLFWHKKAFLKFPTFIIFKMFSICFLFSTTLYCRQQHQKHLQDKNLKRFLKIYFQKRKNQFLSNIIFLFTVLFLCSKRFRFVKNICKTKIQNSVCKNIFRNTKQIFLSNIIFLLHCYFYFPNVFDLFFIFHNKIFSSTTSKKFKTQN